jgi:transcription elongation factor GreA
MTIMTEEKQYLSKEKFEELKKELDFLKTTRRKEIAEKLKFAKSLGDLSENAEYQEARQDQAETENRIQTIDSILTSAEIIHKGKVGSVRVGSTVVIRKKGGRETIEYHIVGSEEADTSVGKISNISPIGAALIGKAKGEIAVYETPKGEVECEVIDIK